jgi:hypothetical protein
MPPPHPDVVDADRRVPTAPTHPQTVVPAPGPSLPALGWAALLLAGLVGLSWVATFLRGPGLGVALSGLESVVIVALPAALLYRVPSAWPTHRLMLLGLLAGSIATALFRAWVPLLAVPPDQVQASPWQQLAVVTGTEVLGIAGVLLLALGLARLRPRTPSHRARRLLPVLVLAALLVAASTFLPLVRYPDAVVPSQVPNVLVSAVIVLGGAPISAYRVWVPLVAWIERGAPTMFWTILGLAALTTLAGMAATLVANLALATGTNLFVPMAHLGEAMGAVGAILVFVALAKLTPVPQEQVPSATLTASVLAGPSRPA